MTRASWHSTTRMGLRAAVASLLTILLSEMFHLEKAYWATLVSVLLVAETWGQSIQRALERLAMTVLGGIAGLAAFLVLGKSFPARAGMLYTCVFFAVYFRPRSYRWMSFFVTGYVIFLFAVLNEFTSHLLFVRIYETAIGCATALVAAALIRPLRASDQLSRAFRRLWELCEQHVRYVFERALDPDSKSPLSEDSRIALYASLLHLHEQRGISRYESLTPLKTGRDWTELLRATRALFQMVVSLEEALDSISSTPLDPPARAALAELQQETLQSFTPLSSTPSSRFDLTRLHPMDSPLALVEDCAHEIRRLSRRLNRQRRGLV